MVYVWFRHILCQSVNEFALHRVKYLGLPGKGYDRYQIGGPAALSYDRWAWLDSNEITGIS